MLEDTIIQILPILYEDVECRKVSSDQLCGYTKKKDNTNKPILYEDVECRKVSSDQLCGYTKKKDEINKPISTKFTPLKI
jgi:hypothetical protein